jgi:hypothetical protein
MKACDALIAWQPAREPPTPGWPPEIQPRRLRAPGGAVAVGRLLRDAYEGDWTAPYRWTGGAAYTARHKLPALEQRFSVMRDWYLLVYTYGVLPYVAHRAMLAIDEYVETIKGMGCGPAKGEPGHDPEVGYGRVDWPRCPR